MKNVSWNTIHVIKIHIITCEWLNKNVKLSQYFVKLLRYNVKLSRESIMLLWALFFFLGWQQSAFVISRVTSKYKYSDKWKNISTWVIGGRRRRRQLFALLQSLKCNLGGPDGSNEVLMLLPPVVWLLWRLCLEGGPSRGDYLFCQPPLHRLWSFHQNIRNVRWD